MKHRIRRLAVSGAAAAALIPAVSAPAHAAPAGDVDCTTRAPYSNGVTVTNHCNHTITVRVQWTNPPYVTNCYPIGAGEPRNFPKPYPASRYYKVLDC
ncbi:hypothetical protein [Actinomadura verrucosospora]|nr:hypothetical protein [Actinomadura verrucosospora]